MRMVPKEKLIELIEAFYKLAALESGGVDNWEWSGDSVVDFLDGYWKENQNAPRGQMCHPGKAGQ